ncbi:MAG TPA: hypothetical protein VM621_15595 [Luteibacter sp.]|nr:hypothetical protein [Luteibacter sp.]
MPVVLLVGDRLPAAVLATPSGASPAIGFEIHLRAPRCRLLDVRLWNLTAGKYERQYFDENFLEAGTTFAENPVDVRFGQPYMFQFIVLRVDNA